jgi:hypothetical protein
MPDDKRREHEKKPHSLEDLETSSLKQRRCPRHGYYQGGVCPDCAIEQLGGKDTR